jgi:hypothetical protein
MALRLDFNVSTAGATMMADPARYSGSAEPRCGAPTASPSAFAKRPGPALRQANCCSAATAPQAEPLRADNSSKIKCIDGYYAILTCQDAVSMVRAAFEGGGVISISPSIV